MRVNTALTWKREDEEHRGAQRGAKYLALIWMLRGGGGFVAGVDQAPAHLAEELDFK